VDELRAALALDPSAAAARSTLAAALLARRDWGAARAELEELARRHPDDPQAHYGLGLVRYAQRDLGGAAEAYRKVLELTPNHQDARYNLALVLKLAGREDEATPEFLAAAEAGMARAQYFAGTAYADGLGVGRNLPLAIAWWMRAAEQGVAPAQESLALLRQAALGRTRRSGVERQAAEQAFRDYRAALRSELRDVSPEADESAGAALLRAGRTAEAVVVLVREASALDEAAQRQLEALYEHGVPGTLPPHDPRILAWFQAAAAEGLTRPRIALARVYGRGLGVPKDVARAAALLRATPHEDARRLLQELTP
jgi:TPR repeat protein